MVQDAQGYVHGCPQPVLVNALRYSAIQFCRRSEAYKYRPPTQNVLAGTANYVFALPTDTEVHGYADVKYDGNSITFNDWDNVTVSDPAYPSIQGTPGTFTYQDPNTLYLVPVPDTAVVSGLLVSLVLRPTLTSAGINTALATRYWEAIIHGAVQRVCLMDKMVWSDAKKALLHGKLFLAGVSDAYSEAQSDFGAQNSHVKIRKFR